SGSRSSCPLCAGAVTDNAGCKDRSGAIARSCREHALACCTAPGRHTDRGAVLAPRPRVSHRRQSVTARFLVLITILAAACGAQNRVGDVLYWASAPPPRLRLLHDTLE